MNEARVGGVRARDTPGKHYIKFIYLSLRSGNCYVSGKAMIPPKKPLDILLLILQLIGVLAMMAFLFS